MSSITISALGPTIGEQLAALGLVTHGKPIETVDRISHALTLAHIHGVLTDSEIDRARTRLLKAAKIGRPRDDTSTASENQPKRAALIDKEQAP